MSHLEEQIGDKSIWTYTRHDHEVQQEFHKEAIEIIDWLVDTVIEPNAKLDFKNFQYEGSSSACFEKKRSEGGVRGLIREAFGLHSNGFLKDPVSNTRTRLNRMYFHPKFGTIELRDDLDVTVTETLIKDWYRENYSCHTTYGGVSGEFIERNMSRLDYLEKLTKRKMDMDEAFVPLSSQVACVTEPLKVRVLTKGEGLPQFIAKSVQTDLHARLRRCKPFRLLGEVVTTDIINELIRMSEGWFDKEDSFWVSGDYSAATDGLNPYLSHHTLHKILSRYQIPPEFYDCCSRVLMMQNIEYPKSSGLTTVLQQKGQLMGSVLSFPILCILNFVTWTLSQKGVSDLLYQSRKLSRSSRLAVLDSFPVLINGDDILFRTRRIDYFRWEETLPHVGFTKSLGKNLLSKKFVTINSAFFWVCRKPKDKDGVKEVYRGTTSIHFDFPNIGLLRGQSKLNNRDRDNKPVWDIHNKVAQSCSSHRNLFTKLFLYYNREVIDDVTSNGLYNLYLPRSLGGCGFVGEPKKYTYFQQQLASYLYRRHRRLGNVMDQDLGLVTKGRTEFSKILDFDKDVLGIRVPKFDVPKCGYRLKEEPIRLSVPNGEDWKEVVSYVRKPIEFDMKNIKPVSIEKLKSFTDLLVTHVYTGYTGSTTSGANLGELCSLPADEAGWEFS